MLVLFQGYKLFDSSNYIVTAGWWCGEVPGETRKLQGSDYIRSVEFFKLWKESIVSNSSPKKIMVLDSASPTKPSIADLKGIEFLSITENPGHSTTHTGKYCGYMRSVIMGITYAQCCNADYWVYVEQDALLKGKGIIDHCISQMKTPYMFGSGAGTPQMLQQSLCIIRKDGFEPFLKRLNKINQNDSEVAPETKFIIASSPILSLLPIRFFKHLNNYGSKEGDIVRLILKNMQQIGLTYDHLPVGYGRSRPIDFEQAYYYFQHGTKQELDCYHLSK